MAVANKFGALVLTTGNKSELGVGYCTLYGDMVGGLAVISDVPKTLVYRLAALRQFARPRDSARLRSPSRLRPSCVRTRRTATRCRPMTCWTAILEEYVDNLKSAQEIAALTGFDRAGDRLRHPADQSQRI